VSKVGDRGDLGDELVEVDAAVEVE